MCIIEYNEAKTFAALRKEERAEGIEIGTLQTLTGLIKDGILSISDAAKRAGMTVSEFESKAGLNT